jgi:hypothetical protein
MTLPAAKASFWFSWFAFSAAVARWRGDAAVARHAHFHARGDDGVVQRGQRGARTTRHVHIVVAGSLVMVRVGAAAVAVTCATRVAKAGRLPTMAATLLHRTAMHTPAPAEPARRPANAKPTWLAVALVAALSGCSGGGGDGGDSPSPGNPSLAQRTQAVQTTAQSSGNACQGIRPFYWEIGNAAGAQASGATDAASGNPTYTANTLMSIASASKWLYGAYVVEKRGGAPTATDRKYLGFQSGYVSFDAIGSCGFGDTVGSCLANGDNGAYTATSDGKFHYDGGHMQKHASLEGLNNLNSQALAEEMRRLLGTDIAFTFSQPQPAGAVVTTAADYARFLRKLLGGSLRMGALLGSEAVCTNPLTCAQAVATPTPLTESWTYTLGHWVDTDRNVGDGAFSSTGAFGFHPWIDASKTSYGVLARRSSTPGTGFDSAVCGRLLRKAWATGTAQ